jgi:hypothetical protein
MVPRRATKMLKLTHHRCARSHTTHRTMAECLWPGAVEVSGEGAFALLCQCRVFTVTLFATAAESGRGCYA